VFRKLGAPVKAACPAFSEVPDIIRGTRAVTMVARHADKLPKWRDQAQKDLVSDVEYGLALTTRDIARSELLRSALWQRVRTFMTTRDLLVLPALPSGATLSGRNQRQTARRLFQWFSNVWDHSDLTPAIWVPCGFTRSGLPRV